jgi:hypothetical protein
MAPATPSNSTFVNNIIKACCIVAMAVCGVVHAAQGDGVYTYSSYGMEAENWGDPLFIMIGEAPRKMPPFVGAGSEVQHAAFCGAHESSICVASEILTFSAPKHLVSVGEDWVYNSIRFSVSREIRLSVLGREIQGFRILGWSGTQIRWVFIYSYEVGLVLIEDHSESRGAPITYFLENKVGFGANKLH